MESDLLHSRRVTQRPLLEGMALLLCMAMLTSATTSAHSQCFRGLLAVISVEVCCSQQEQPATHRSRLIGNTTLRAAVHMQELQAAQAYTAAVHSKMGQATHTASRLQSSTKLAQLHLKQHPNLLARSNATHRCAAQLHLKMV
jgi:hypothetical protein